MFRLWPPQKVHRSVFEFSFFIKSVQPGEEHGFKSKLSEEPCIRTRMAKCVQVPSNSWLDAKLLQEEGMAQIHVVENILVVGTSLVSGTPPSVCKLKSAFSHQHLDVLLHLWRLSVVPHREILHLHIRKDSLRIFQQLFNHCVQNQPHVCVLRVLVGA